MDPMLMALLMQLGILPPGFGQGEQGQGQFPNPFSQFNPFGQLPSYGQGGYGQGAPQMNRQGYGNMNQGGYGRPGYGPQPGQSQTAPQFPGLPPQALANAFHQNPTALANSQAPTGLPTPMPFGGMAAPQQPQERRPQPFQP